MFQAFLIQAAISPECFIVRPELAAKQLELLTQAFPNATRLGIMWNALSADQFRSGRAGRASPPVGNPVNETGEAALRFRGGVPDASRRTCTDGSGVVQPLLQRIPLPGYLGGAVASLARHVYLPSLCRGRGTDLVWG